MPIDALNDIASLPVSYGGNAVSLRDYIDARSLAVNNSSEARQAAVLLEIKRLDQAMEAATVYFQSVRDAQGLAAKIFSDKMDSQFKGIAENQVFAKEAIQLQFISISKGTETATTALDKRLESLNESRQQINDMAVKFITRTEVESTMKYMNDRVSAMEVAMSNRITREEMGVQYNAIGERVSSLEKFSNNLQGRMWVIAAVVVVMEVALRFLGGK